MKGSWTWAHAELSKFRLGCVRFRKMFSNVWPHTPFSVTGYSSFFFAGDQTWGNKDGIFYQRTTSQDHGFYCKSLTGSTYSVLNFSTADLSSTLQLRFLSSGDVVFLKDIHSNTELASHTKFPLFSSLESRAILAFSSESTNF